MPKKPKIRIFAGPNGSGKSTLVHNFPKKYNLGYFINADNLEKKLSETGLIDLEEIGISPTLEEFEHFKETPTAKSLFVKAENSGHLIDVAIRENFIVDKSKKSHSYEGSFVASFIREIMMNKKISFSFETVMSHHSKIEELREAKQKGYRVYLYYVCTDDSLVNISRVQNRVKKGGHFVAKEKIISRYEKTLENLKYAVEIANRVYFFDNSGKEMLLIAETDDNMLTIHQDILPNWFVKFLEKNYSQT